ncbi:group I intron-associated PD-(D/E)XK endonuclease [Lysinibacillus xylanilyticus]|uniref:group I intron-associated PD-(D/E)XK endonuclease n=1 Tax=Lysinibacillus xylanilyticus TaxID=582475 RepID=UPI003D03DF92
MTQNELSTSTIGRHSELLAMAALLADGWSVSEPTVPEAHDLIAVKGEESLRIQVKTIKQREKDGVPYYVIRGLKNNREVYSLSDCDAFIGVVGEHVYLAENKQLTEYWAKVSEVNEKWRYLPLKITEKGAIN